MTALDVFRDCAVAGCELYLRPDGGPAVRGNVPNAALMAALKEHRTGIIRLLGGDPEPERCEEYRLLVYEPVDAFWWCPRWACRFRQRVR